MALPSLKNLFSQVSNLFQPEQSDKSASANKTSWWQKFFQGSSNNLNSNQANQLWSGVSSNVTGKPPADEMQANINAAKEAQKVTMNATPDGERVVIELVWHTRAEADKTAKNPKEYWKAILSAKGFTQADLAKYKAKHGRDLIDVLGPHPIKIEHPEAGWVKYDKRTNRNYYHERIGISAKANKMLDETLKELRGERVTALTTTNQTKKPSEPRGLNTKLKEKPETPSIKPNEANAGAIALPLIAGAAKKVVENPEVVAAALPESVPLAMVIPPLAGGAAMADMAGKMNAERIFAARELEADIQYKIEDITIANENAEPQLQPETQTKPKAPPRPYAEPATPKVDEIPVAPPKGEITVRPKEVPATPKVDTPKLDLPDAPQTPQVPQTPITPQLPNLPQLPKGIIEAITGAITAAIGVKADQMLSGGKVPDYTPTRYKDVKLTPEMKAEIGKLAEYRDSKGFPKAGKNTGAGTIASTTVEGETFIGHSTVNERAVLDKDNFELRKQLFDDLKNAGYIQKDIKHYDKQVNFLYHAEIETILEAKQKLGDLKGKDLVIYVDRKPCESCYNHLPKVAELYGIKSITIISSNPEQNPEIVVITKNGVK